MKKGKKLLIALLVAVLVLSSAFAAYKYLETKETDAVSDEQRQIKPSTPVNLMDSSHAQLLAAFAELKAINPDVVAWLSIDELGIDYPIVKGTDNSYYLTHTAEKKVNRNGALFMEYKNNGDFSDFYTTIYGHNMRSGRMFGQLTTMKRKSVFDSVKTGYLATESGVYKLEIFAVCVTKATGKLFGYVFADESAKLAQLDLIKTTAVQYRDIGVTTDSRLLSLSTCSWEFNNARTLVVARLVAA
jgi:sortase B